MYILGRNKWIFGLGATDGWGSIESQTNTLVFMELFDNNKNIEQCHPCPLKTYSMWCYQNLFGSF